MSAFPIPAIKKRGPVLNGLTSLPASLKMMTVDDAGNMGVQDIPVAPTLAWGNITGTLSAQTDLQTALNAKANTSHTHAISDVTNLQSSLDAKANSSALANYLPLTGGTLTGGLSGTTATFSGNVNGSNLVASNGISGYTISSNASRCLMFNHFNVANGFGYTFSPNNSAANGSEEFGWYRDATRSVALSGGANATRLNLYGTYTDASNYRRLYISSTTAGAFTLGVEGLGTGLSGNTLNIANNLGIGTSSANVGLVIRRSGTDLPALRLEDGDVTVPFTGISFSPNINANTVGAWQPVASASGGCAFTGFTNNTAAAYPVLFEAYHGSASPTAPAVCFSGFKTNGSTGATTLASNELLAGFYNGSVAGSPVVTISAAGNLAAVAGTFSGALSVGGNITPTSSSAGSGRIEMVNQQYTASNVAINMPWGTGTQQGIYGSNGLVGFASAGTSYFEVNTSGLRVAGNRSIGLGGTIASPEVTLFSGGANVLEQRNGANAQRFNLYGTYTDPSNYRRFYISSTTGGAFTLGVEGLGTGASGNTLTLLSNIVQIGGATNGLNVQSNGTTHFWSGGNINFNVSGSSMILGGSLFGDPTNPSCAIGWANSHVATAISVGFRYGGTTQVNLQGTHAGAFQDLALRRLVFEGNTSSFPMIRRNGTAINFRLADDSADAPIAASYLQTGTQATRYEETGITVLQSGTRYPLITWTAGQPMQAIAISGFAYRGINIQRATGLQTWLTVNLEGSSSAFGDTPRQALDVRGNAIFDGNVVLHRSTTSTSLQIHNTFTDASNFIRQALSFTTYSGTIYAQHVAEGLGTGAVNIPFVITPRGTGAFIVGPMPDGTSTGGNARGSGSVDLQTVRSSAADIASGNNCFVAGQNSRATNDTCIALGWQARATGIRSTAIGDQVTASGLQSFAGGAQCNSSGSQSFAWGYLTDATASLAMATGQDALANRLGMLARSSGAFSAKGDCQKASFIARIKTTNATPTTLMLDGSFTRLTVNAGEIFGFIANITGSKSDGSAIAHYVRKGAIKRVGTTTTLAYVETVGTDYEDNAATDVSITADDTNEALQIQVTGIAGETWRWVATVEAADLGFGT